MHDNRHWRFAIRTLIGVGFLLPIITVFLYISGEYAVLVIDRSPIVAEGSRGSDVVLEVPVLNRGEDTVRVVGAKKLCLVSGCVKEAPELPMEIRGHESRLIRVVYRLGWEDEPPYVLTFYTNCPAQPEFTVAIHNKCTQSQSQGEKIGARRANISMLQQGGSVAQLGMEDEPPKRAARSAYLQAG